MQALRLITTESTEKLESFFTNYIRAYETGHQGTKHYHYMFDTSYSIKYIRNFIISTFGKGNSVYSLKAVRDVLKYGAYILKEDKNFINKGFDEETIKSFLEYDQQIKADMKKQKSSILKELIDFCKDCVDEHSLIKSIIRFYKINNKIINPNIMKHYVLTVGIHLGLYAEQALIEAIRPNLPTEYNLHI